MNGVDGVRATVADMHRGDIVCAHAGLPETMNDAQDAARTGAESPEPAARAVTGLLDAANDTERSDGAPDAPRTFAGLLDAAIDTGWSDAMNDAGRSDGAPDAPRAVAGPLDAASDTSAGPLGYVNDAPPLRDVLLFCSEI